MANISLNGSQHFISNIFTKWPGYSERISRIKLLCHNLRITEDPLLRFDVELHASDELIIVEIRGEPLSVENFWHSLKFAESLINITGKISPTVMAIFKVHKQQVLKVMEKVAQDVSEEFFRKATSLVFLLQQSIAKTVCFGQIEISCKVNLRELVLNGHLASLEDQRCDPLKVLAHNIWRYAAYDLPVDDKLLDKVEEQTTSRILVTHVEMLKAIKFPASSNIEKAATSLTDCVLTLYWYPRTNVPSNGAPYL